MKPYGQNNKLSANLVDNHPRPKRIYVNWWEKDVSIIKNREKQKSKKEIENQIKDLYE